MSSLIFVLRPIRSGWLVFLSCVVINFLIFATGIFTINVEAVSSFVATWDTEQLGGTGSPTQTIVLPVAGNYSVNWGDGTIENNVATHVYAVAGVKTITITGNPAVTSFKFNNGGDKLKILNISNWGNMKLGGGGNYFKGCANLTASATDMPNLAGTTSLAGAFQDATAFNGDITGWNTSAITNMSNMFRGASSFNRDISGWETSAVTNMSGMFYGAAAFNKSIGSWNTGAVLNMSNMFRGAANFNRNLNSWNTALVTDMNSMFRDATSFNGDISGWNTGAVTDMAYLFSGASAFNKNLNGWNTVAVTDMNHMFAGAAVYDQPMGNWNTALVSNMVSMFQDAATFNRNLGSWDTHAVTNINHMFSGATAFDQTLGSWNTLSITDMSQMFYGAAAFNKDLSGWRTDNVTTMQGMFRGASVFNQNISSWNTANVTNMVNMFYQATAFERDLSSWNTSNVTDMSGMFHGVLLSTAHYDALLLGWSGKPQIHSVNFDAGNSKYSVAGQPGRDTLTSTYGWNIDDGGVQQYLSQKTTAHNDLQNAYNAYSSLDYTTANWNTLSDYKTGGDTAIDAAMTPADITAAKDAAVNSMTGVETIVEALAADVVALNDAMIKGLNPALDHITISLSNPLPASGAHGSAISWLSDRPAYISHDGQTIVRPAYGTGNALVTLTATFTIEGHTDTKTFTLTVLASDPLPSPTPTATPRPTATPTPVPTLTPTPEVLVILLNDYAEFLGGEAGKLIPNLQVGQVINYTFQGEAHTVTIKSIFDTYIIVTLASTPRDLRIILGDSVSYDANSDGIADLRIRLNSISGGKADLSFAMINTGGTPVPSVLPETGSTTTPTATPAAATVSDTGNFAGWLLGGVLLLTGVGAGYLLLTRNKK